MVIIDIKGVESTTIFFLDILLLDQRRWCIGYYPEIRCKTTPGSIIDVYIDPFFYGHILIASFLYLPETRDPGRGHETGRIVARRQWGSLIQGKRTIPYQGHIPQKNIDHLSELTQPRIPKTAANTRYPRAIVALKKYR